MTFEDFEAELTRQIDADAEHVHQQWKAERDEALVSACAQYESAVRVEESQRKEAARC